MSLNVKYMGLDLPSPVIAASSPLTAGVDKIEKLAAHGAGAVVLKSVFEEQIMGESAMLERYNDYPEAADYLGAYVKEESLKGHLDLIREAKRRVHIPVIASINCQRQGSWLEYARAIGDAGADALQLNIFILPASAKASSGEIEEAYLDIAARVAQSVSIPVSVKLGMRFTNVLALAEGLYHRGVKGVVMFNRFYAPDIDVDTMSFTSGDMLSARSELRGGLRYATMCASEVPALDLALATGIHTGEDVVKALLSGAKAVEVCSTLYLNGPEYIAQMNAYLAGWMDTHSFTSVDDFSGKMNYRDTRDKEMLERVQYMKFFPKER